MKYAPGYECAKTFVRQDRNTSIQLPLFAKHETIKVFRVYKNID